MRKTRDLFKKIRDTKGTFHAKMGSTKDRNGLDLTEAEDIKKRWQEYTELSKRMFMTRVSRWCDHSSRARHPGMWALESITTNKASGGDGIPVELFQIIYFCFIDYAKAFDCVDHNKLWKMSSRDGNTRPPDLPLKKSVCSSGSNS